MTQEMTSRHSVGPLNRALYSPTKCNQPSSAQLGLARPGSASLGLARPGLGLARLGYITSLQARGSCLFTRPGLGLDSAWPRLGLGLAWPNLARPRPGRRPALSPKTAREPRLTHTAPYGIHFSLKNKIFPNKDADTEPRLERAVCQLYPGYGKKNDDN